MTESQIHSQLLRIRSQSWKTDKEPMGILTSEHRHTWGQAYNRLLKGTAQRYVTGESAGRSVGSQRFCKTLMCSD